jgi:hypothetical protein
MRLQKRKAFLELFTLVDCVASYFFISRLNVTRFFAAGKTLGGMFDKK